MKSKKKIIEKHLKMKIFHSKNSSRLSQFQTKMLWGGDYISDFGGSIFLLPLLSRMFQICRFDCRIR